MLNLTQSHQTAPTVNPWQHLLLLWSHSHLCHATWLKIYCLNEISSCQVHQYWLQLYWKWNKADMCEVVHYSALSIHNLYPLCPPVGHGGLVEIPGDIGIMCRYLFIYFKEFWESRGLRTICPKISDRMVIVKDNRTNWVDCEWTSSLLTIRFLVL